MTAGEHPVQGRAGAVAAALLALVLTSGLFSLTGNAGLLLDDEGFLWYGVQRTVAGEIPLRDFQSYEPGRYFWSASFSPVWGDGLLAVRRSSAVFAAIGLFCGLLAARRAAGGYVSLAVMAGVLALWMVPRHKLFDSSLAMLAVLCAVRLVERPDRRRHLEMGVFVGAAAFVGRNHALYAGIGAVLLGAWLAWIEPGDLRRRAAAFAGGVAVGTIPLALMLLAVPGFAAGFFDSLLFFVERGSNLPLAIPWPWSVDYGALDAISGPAAFCVGLGFVLLYAVPAAGVVLALRTRREQRTSRALLVAASGIALCYAHHASVRSDASHLAQAVHPMWLALFAWPAALGWAAEKRAVLLTLAAVVTVLALPRVDPWLGRWLPGVAPMPVAELEVAGAKWQVTPREAREIEGLRAVVSDRIGSEEPIFIAPVRPGLYPLLGRRAPGWDVYFLWAADETRQRRIVDDLEAREVDWALVSTGNPMNEPALRFSITHPTVWSYLERHFRPVADPRLPAGQRLLRRLPGRG